MEKTLLLILKRLLRVTVYDPATLKKKQHNKTTNPKQQNKNQEKNTQTHIFSEIG